VTKRSVISCQDENDLSTLNTSFVYTYYERSYEGRSINKLRNCTIPLILKIGKIRNIRFVGNLILKIHRNFFDDDVIIVTSSIHRTQSICVLFSPPVFYHNSSDKQHRNEEKNE